jgi:hypothetical protein
VSESFNKGDKVRKVGGNYQAYGTVVCTGVTSLGKTLVLFEFDSIPGMVHLFGEAQLEHVEAHLVRAYRRGAKPE